MQVETVGLSQPLELSVFSLDRSAFVDRPVERAALSQPLSNCIADGRELDECCVPLKRRRIEGRFDAPSTPVSGAA